MTWFEELTGFPELSPQQVRENIFVDGDVLQSRINNRRMTFGKLETPSLGDLRNRVQSRVYNPGNITVKEVVANVQCLHLDVANAGALFQVASQFNLLEMVSPYVTPEDGVAGYQYDLTQGPACAVAAGAGTIYRNYFAEVNGQIGQTTSDQIDCLSDLGKALGNSDNSLWEFKNGYILASDKGLQEISKRLLSANESELDGLRALLRIGIQWHTEVTLSGCNHQITQAYCSALPVAYSSHHPRKWELFARLVLEAAYEATFCAAILNSIQSGKKLYLTLLGGGAFGNKTEWIIASIQRALRLYKHFDLEIIIVSFGSSKLEVQCLLTD